MLTTNNGLFQGHHVLHSFWQLNIRIYKTYSYSSTNFAITFPIIYCEKGAIRGVLLDIFLEGLYEVFDIFKGYVCAKFGGIPMDSLVVGPFHKF